VFCFCWFGLEMLQGLVVRTHSHVTYMYSKYVLYIVKLTRWRIHVYHVYVFNLSTAGAAVSATLAVLSSGVVAGVRPGLEPANASGAGAASSASASAIGTGTGSKFKKRGRKKKASASLTKTFNTSSY
jgi:hypothetical protein